jgi:hypothetical protein
VPLWKSYNLTNHPNFQSFLSEDNVIIRFYFQEDTAGFGNRFYLDQVNFDLGTGLNELTRSVMLNLYPNPASGAAHVSFNLNETKNVGLNICNVSGQRVMDRPATTMGAGSHTLTLGECKSLSPGIYFVNVDFDGMRAVRKLVVE